MKRTNSLLVLAIALVSVFLSSSVSAMISLDENISVDISGTAISVTSSDLDIEIVNDTVSVTNLEGEVQTIIVEDVVGVETTGVTRQRMQNRMETMVDNKEAFQVQAKEFQAGQEVFRLQLSEGNFTREEKRELVRERKTELISAFKERVGNRVENQVAKLKRVKDWVVKHRSKLDERVSKIENDELRVAAEEKKEALLMKKDEIAGIISNLSSQRELLASLKEDENWEELQPALEAYKAELQKFKQALNMGIGQAKNMYQAIK